MSYALVICLNIIVRKFLRILCCIYTISAIIVVSITHNLYQVEEVVDVVLLKVVVNMTALISLLMYIALFLVITLQEIID